MRRLTLASALVGLILLAGCSTLNKPNPHGTGNTTARPRLDRPTAPVLVAALNENSRRVPALQCTDLTLDCRQGRESGVVSGRLDCQKPKNFRLTARVVGQPAVDIGSNNEEFWYWISKAQPPYVYHCPHEALARGGVRMPFPFQPDMILAALGMAEYDLNKQYEVKVQARTIELIENTTSPQGQPIQKVTVFNRNPSGDQPLVAAHILRDQRGREICTASITHVSRDPATGAELPRRVRLVWPDQQIELKMKLDEIRVVQPNPQLAQTLYSRRNLASQQSFDLSRWQLDEPTGQVQRVGDPPR
jgi:hypothetical protein